MPVIDITWLALVASIGNVWRQAGSIVLSLLFFAFFSTWAVWLVALATAIPVRFFYYGTIVPAPAAADPERNLLFAAADLVANGAGRMIPLGFTALAMLLALGAANRVHDLKPGVIKIILGAGVLSLVFLSGANHLVATSNIWISIASLLHLPIFASVEFMQRVPIIGIALDAAIEPFGLSAQVSEALKAIVPVSIAIIAMVVWIETWVAAISLCLSGAYRRYFYTALRHRTKRPPIGIGDVPTLAGILAALKPLGSSIIRMWVYAGGFCALCVLVYAAYAMDPQNTALLPIRHLLYVPGRLAPGSLGSLVTFLTPFAGLAALLLAAKALGVAVSAVLVEVATVTLLTFAGVILASQAGWVDPTSVDSGHVTVAMLVYLAACTALMARRILWSGIVHSKQVLQTALAQNRSARDIEALRPALYLRAFKDDALALSRPWDVFSFVMGSFSSRERFEEAIARRVLNWRPLVALSNPHLPYQFHGATKHPVPSHADWKREVIHWNERSAYALMIANTTDNLGWEVELLKNTERQRRAIYVATDNNRAKAFLTRFGILPEGLIERELPKGVVVVYWDVERGWTTIRTRIRTYSAFRLAVDIALAAQERALPGWRQAAHG